MNAIVVHDRTTPPLPEYRDIVRSFASSTEGAGWNYDPFPDYGDLLSSIGAGWTAGGGTIEIVAHGSPAHIIDDCQLKLDDTTVNAFSRSLLPLLDRPSDTMIYLTGCNTGLFLDDFCIAEALAFALRGVTVCGAAGDVMSGTAAGGDAVTAVNVPENYGGEARSAQHPNCWNCFCFPPSNDVEIERAQPRPPVLDTHALSYGIEAALERQEFGPLPPLLIAPDFQGTVVLPNGRPFRYELLRGLTIVRDADTRRAYSFAGGGDLLRMLPR